MEICNVQVSRTSLIFSTVGATVGYFTTHNLNPILAGIISSIAFDVLWGIPFSPTEKAIEEEGGLAFRCFRWLKLCPTGLAWFLAAGPPFFLLYTERSKPNSLFYIISTLRCFSHFLVQCSNWKTRREIKYDPSSTNKDIQENENFARPYAVSDFFSTIGGIFGLWLGLHTKTLIPIGAATGWTMGKITEKVYAYVQKRFATQDNRGAAARAVD